MTKVIFNICYEPSLISKISEMMSKCDLGISGILYPVFETWSWETTTKVDKKYINKMMKQIEKFFKETRSGKLISLELDK